MSRLDSDFQRQKFRVVHAGVLNLCKTYLATETIKKTEDTTGMKLAMLLPYSVGDHDYKHYFPSVNACRPKKQRRTSKKSQCDSPSNSDLSL
jgi:hypothetical protein